MTDKKPKAGAKDWAVCPICREKWVDCQHNLTAIVNSLKSQLKEEAKK